MKNMKKMVLLAAAVGIMGSAGAVYAATAKTPADIASALTGKTVEDVVKEKAAGKTYGTIAKDAGKLEEFKVQMLEQKKLMLDQKVKDGVMTQEQADTIYNNIKDNQANCDGTGNSEIGKKCGAGFGKGMGNGTGNGMKNGKGMGRGMRNGKGLNK
jgi:hypothetical protein